MKTCTYLWLLVSIASYSTLSVGKETQDNQQQLLTSCQALAAQSEQVSSNACIYYIQGLLAGMRFTDTVNATSLDEANNHRPSFIERAYNTRVGDRDLPKRFTDTVNATPLDEANSHWSSFIERAYNTRVGDRDLPKQPTRFNHFCLPNDESLAQVIDVLSKPLSSTTESNEMLKASIFHVLKAEYPCA